MSDRPWIGVDLDGTLAKYEGWQGPAHIGEPVPAMVERVRRWIEQGEAVKIFTARITPDPDRDVREVVTAIQDWAEKHIGHRLPVTNVKDYAMVELWDDRCVAVEPNTGRPLNESTRGLV